MATTYAIKWLKDKLGVKFFPVTHIKAVRDDNNIDLDVLLGRKQDTLVSGTNIKTINNTSILGSGNIEVSVPTKTSDLTNDSNFVSDANYVHTDNNFTGTLKTKLEGIAEGAEVNQNAFSNVKVGTSTIAADTKTDTLTLTAGSNITLTSDVTNDAVTIAATVPTKVSDLTNDSNFITAAGAPVQSINSKTGTVTLTASDVGALPDTTTIPTKTSDLTNDSGYITSVPVTSVNNQIGDIILSASDVGALPDTTVIPVQSVNGMIGNVVVPDPFMLLDFNQIINVLIPSCLNDIPNTSIPNVDVSITDEIGADWAIASLAKYEVFDAKTGGNRINVFPVCMFSMNGQKILRLRMMAAGSNEKRANRISGALLLKHR